jgi:hypothetical protein
MNKGDKEFSGAKGGYYQYDDGERARAILMSTKDIMFKGRTNSMMDWSGKVVESISIPDTDVLCNGCNKNMYPENCFGVEFANAESGWEWALYDVYCPDCLEKTFSMLPKLGYAPEHYHEENVKKFSHEDEDTKE